ncbi:hypothetical protein ACXR2U_05570 [Jatrophihabitans sp. YIM 134969]
MTDDDLRAEIVALRTRLADLEARLDAPPPSEPAPKPVSRRGLLAAAVGGAAGLVATQVTTAAPAAAAPGNAVVLGAINDGGGTITTVQSNTGLNSSPFAVVNDDPNGTSIGFFGRLGPASGVFDGTFGQRAAVMGDSKNSSAVSGLSANNCGVYAQSLTSYGLKAASQEDVAVRADSETYYGVYATTNSADHAGVVGSSPVGTGVLAASTSGTGLEAVAGGGGSAVDANSALGLGIQAKGGRAPLRLVPSKKTGKPTSGAHAIGELYVDQVGGLYLCTRAGTPGTWKKVTVS